MREWPNHLHLTKALYFLFFIFLNNFHIYMNGILFIGGTLTFFVV